LHHYFSQLREEARGMIWPSRRREAESRTSKNGKPSGGAGRALPESVNRAARLRHHDTMATMAAGDIGPGFGFGTHLMPASLPDASFDPQQQIDVSGPTDSCMQFEQRWRWLGSIWRVKMRPQQIAHTWSVITQAFMASPHS
jgi:hypothetical protein